MTPRPDAPASPLKRIREGQGLSQPELAVRSGVSIKTIARIESGERGRRQTIRALAQALQVSEADLGYDADGATPILEESIARVDARLADVGARLARVEDLLERLVAATGGAAAEEAAEAAELLAAKTGARRQTARRQSR